MNIRNIANINDLGRATAVTVGMFDGVHLGHRHILSTLDVVAKRTGLLPVVITFDCHPRMVLGSVDGGFRLLNTNEERFSLLQDYGVKELALVHFTPEVASLSSCAFLQRYLVSQLNAKALVLGYDNVFGSKKSNDFDSMRGQAMKENIDIVDDTPVMLDGMMVSSTQIRSALRQGDVDIAAKMLGYRYRVSGHVEQGRQVGRAMGFPTANVAIDNPFKALPADGVYAVRVRIDGCSETDVLRGMANLGGKPTFNLDIPTFEVNLFDFDGDLYGRVLDVEFAHRLRSVQRFASMEELVSQLRRDRCMAEQVLARE